MFVFFVFFAAGAQQLSLKFLEESLGFTVDRNLTQLEDCCGETLITVTEAKGLTTYQKSQMAAFLAFFTLLWKPTMNLTQEIHIPQIQKMPLIEVVALHA